MVNAYDGTGFTKRKTMYDKPSSTSYTYGTGLASLPTGVTGPTGRTFDHWTINNETVTEISAETTGAVTIKAVYTCYLDAKITKLFRHKLTTFV